MSSRRSSVVSNSIYYYILNTYPATVSTQSLDPVIMDDGVRNDKARQTAPRRA